MTQTTYLNAADAAAALFDHAVPVHGPALPLSELITLRAADLSSLAPKTFGTIFHRLHRPERQSTTTTTVTRTPRSLRETGYRDTCHKAPVHTRHTRTHTTAEIGTPQQDTRPADEATAK